MKTTSKNIMKKIWLSLCIVAMVMSCFMFVSCKQIQEEPKLELSLNVTEKTMTVDETFVAKATIRNADSKEVVEGTVVWKSENEKIATVKDGKITAVSEGETKITATYKDLSAVINLKVNPLNFTIAVDPESIILFEGEQQVVTATPSDGKEYAFTWESLNPEIATVESDGTVTALKAGNAVIRVSYKTVSKDIAVEVQHEDVVLVFDRESAELNVGEELVLVPMFSDGSTHELTWESSDALTATVGNDGKVTALKNGQVTITAKATLDPEGELTASCVVTISDVVSLAFPEIAAEGKVGDVIDLGLSATMNGNPVELSEIVVTGEGFEYLDGKITINASGKLSIKAEYRTESVTREIVVWKEIATTEEFVAMQDNLGGYYRLANDLDFGGAQIPAFSSWGTKETKTFHGRFDGQGHSVTNFEVGKIGSDYSIFGYVNKGGVIENVAFLNVVGRDRFSTVVSWLEEGTIQNVFLHMKDYVANGALSENNPAGTICAKVQPKGVVRNCVVVLDKFTAKTTYFGGVVAKLDKGGKLENCQLIYNGDDVNIFAVDKSNGTAVVNNCAKYATVDAFYDEATGADLSLFDDKVWNLNKGYIPMLKGFTDEIVADGGETEIYKGNSLDLSFIKSKGHKLALLEESAGITLDGTILTVGNEATKESVTVVATSIYDPAITKNFVFTINSDILEIVWGDIPEVTWTKGEVKEQDITVSLTVNSAPSEDYELAIANAEIAEINGKKITYKGDGKTSVQLIYKGVVASEKEFSSIMYIPVTTVAEFQNIGTDQKTMSGKYKLMNDLDFDGIEFHAFSSYKTQGKLRFTGIFDGMGHSISNMIPFFNTTDPKDRDRSVFGFMDEGAIVRNVAFLGMRCYDRTGIVSSWAQKGSLIENVLIDATYVKPLGNLQANNPTGFICAKLQKGCIVRNCIVRLNVDQYNNGSYSASLCGGIVGINAGKVENCQLIYDDVKGAIELVYKNNNGEVLNSNKYANAEALLNAETGADLTLYSDDYWVKPEGYIPHLKGFTDEMEITGSQIQAGFKSKDLIADIKSKGHTVALKEPVEGVRIENGMLIIDNASLVPVDQVTVVAYSVYDPMISQEFVITLVRSQDELLTVDKTEYVEGESIMVTASGTTSDWVGIYRKYCNLSARWYYLGGEEDGKPFDIRSGKLGGDSATNIPAGLYTIIYVKSVDGKEETLAWKDVVVKEATFDPSLLSTDKKEYLFGEPIMVTATGDEDNDWVGLYKADAGTSLVYYYPKVDNANGTPIDIINTTQNGGYYPILPGDYEVRYNNADNKVIAWVKIKVLARDPAEAFIVGDPNYELHLDKRVFAEGEAIMVTAKDANPGHQDWIGIMHVDEGATRYYDYLSAIPAEGMDIRGNKTIEKGTYLIIVVPDNGNAYNNHAPNFVSWTYITVE